MSIYIAPWYILRRLHMLQLTKLDQDLVWGKDKPAPGPPREADWVCSVEGFERIEGWKPTSLRGFSATVLRFTLDWPLLLGLQKACTQSMSPPPPQLDNLPHPSPGHTQSVHSPVMRNSREPVRVFKTPNLPSHLELPITAPVPPNPFAWSPPHWQGHGTS